MSDHDLVIRGGTVFDGTGGDPFVADVAIYSDTIAAIGPGLGRGETELDATGLAVAPGFINMLSHSQETLIADGRSQSEIRQGVTLVVMGEGRSMGPLSETMRADARGAQGDIKYEIKWTTLGEYLDWLAARGISTNIASFIGAATPRIHEIGYEDRPPTEAEMERMCAIVDTAMAEGAMGVSSALIYPPAFYAPTAELVALARAAANRGGLYISHIRSEGSRVLEALDELITISRESGARAEIYHLKASGRSNWHKFPAAIEKVEAARADGVQLTADMYTYAAAGTGLSSVIPPWAHEGGHRALVDRLRDPAARARIAAEMVAPSESWENLYLGAGSPDNILLAGFKQEALKPLAGKTLAEVAAARGASPPETAMDLIVEDDSRIFTIYSSMDEANVRRAVALPWVSFGSDAGSMAPEGVFLRSHPHPRAYGTFARLLGRYVREEGLVRLEEAIRRLTALPADTLRLRSRGRLLVGNIADVAVFDPVTIIDHATFADPHRYATGMVHVLVNGVPVLQEGDHTDARPGRVVRGPGYGPGR
jgi:N-acyl-D-amino-acid deacylase